MTELPKALRLVRQAGRADGSVVLDYDARLLRRKRLETTAGESFLVDLPEVTGVDQGDCFQLADGRLIEVLAATEEVLEVTGDLPRLAWHIGNRHTPCQIGAGRLLIRQDHVLEAMLIGLGATVTRRVAPFTPEGGAYGHGRTMGHDHAGGRPALPGFIDHGDGQWHAHGARLPFGHRDAKG
ncbi:MAG: urease accessory protein UreE [Tabrizicola sp.]|nr:urease accessory protein UreE [Tabrizicola sp.]